jgi:hypothetical protein
MEPFEETVLDTADQTHAAWLKYFEDTFVVWPHGPEECNFCVHWTNLGTTKFALEGEINVLHFFDVLVMKGLLCGLVVRIPG